MKRNIEHSLKMLQPHINIKLAYDKFKKIKYAGLKLNPDLIPAKMNNTLTMTFTDKRFNECHKLVITNCIFVSNKLRDRLEKKNVWRVKILAESVLVDGKSVREFLFDLYGRGIL